MSRALVALVAPSEPPASAPPADRDPVQTTASSAESDLIAATVEPGPPQAQVEEVELACEANVPEADHAEEFDAEPAPGSPLIESTTWLDEALPVAIEEAQRAEVAPFAPAAPVVAPESGRPGRAEPSAIEPPQALPPLRKEFPSAREIFAAQARRVSPVPEAARSTRKKSQEPEPTEIFAPACWSMPSWLGTIPVILATMTLGFGGIALAIEWAVESNNANQALQLVMRPEGTPGSSIDPAVLPRGAWWSSTAPHQAAWALALARSTDGEDHSEDIRSLLDSSSVASKLAARSRYVVDLPDSSEPNATTDLADLGRTRDVATLVRTGRRLHKAGKRDAAIRAYRSAMEIASKARIEDVAAPAFLGDPQVRRYALPRESLLAIVARTMAEDGDWSADQWTEALPPSAAASFVASRVLDRMQKRVEADRFADQAIQRSESPTPDGYDPAEDRAAGAEALAYRGRWSDAAEQYRRAIDQAEDDSTRRMWWLNLAELAQRTSDDAGRVRAIEAAKAPNSVDEITRRALSYQQGLPGLASTGVRP